MESNLTFEEYQKHLQFMEKHDTTNSSTTRTHTRHRTSSTLEPPTLTNDTTDSNTTT